MGTILIRITIPDKTQADAESLKVTLQGVPALATAEVQVQYFHTV